MEAQVVAIDQPFHSAYEKFIEITAHLSTEMSYDKTHSEMEAYLETAGRELLRLLLQDHLDNQGSGRVGEAVCGSDGVVRSPKRDHMETGYKSVFGAVRLARTGYSQRGVASLFPRDAQLNLPAQDYAHRLQKRVAVKAVKESFEGVVNDIATETGVRIGKRQVEQIVYAAAQDFDAFSAQLCAQGKGKPQTDGDGGRHLSYRPSYPLSANGGAAVCAPAVGSQQPATRPQARGQEAVGQPGKAHADGDGGDLCR